MGQLKSSNLFLITLGFFLLLEWLSLAPLLTWPSTTHTLYVYSVVVTPLWLIISIGLIVAGIIRELAASRSQP